MVDTSTLTGYSLIPAQAKVSPKIYPGPTFPIIFLFPKISSLSIREIHGYTFPFSLIANFSALIHVRLLYVLEPDNIFVFI